MKTFNDLWKISKDTPGWLKDTEAWNLYILAKHISKGGKIVELGSFCGKSSVILAGVSQDKNTFIAVDDFSSPGCSVEKLENNLKKVSSDYLIKPMRSDEAFKDISAPIDLIFIDTVHTYEAVKHDINLWLPKMADNAYILFHDYCSKYDGVRQAVDEACREKKLRFFNLSYSLAITKKV